MDKKDNEKKTPEEAEQNAANDVLKDMVSSLNELPTDVLEQLLKNLEAIEEEHKKKNPPKKVEKKPTKKKTTKKKTATKK